MGPFVRAGQSGVREPLGCLMQENYIVRRKDVWGLKKYRGQRDACGAEENSVERRNVWCFTEAQTGGGRRGGRGARRGIFWAVHLLVRIAAEM